VQVNNSVCVGYEALCTNFTAMCQLPCNPADLTPVPRTVRTYWHPYLTRYLSLAVVLCE
jgi:hypothetical protein